MSKLHRGPHRRRNTTPSLCSVVGGPLDNDEMANLRATFYWVADLISPKCRVPVSIWTDTYSVYTFTPNIQNLLCSGNSGDVWRASDGDFKRQHMSPGLVNWVDQGKALGALTYMGGALAAATDNAVGVYSDGARTNDATHTWNGLKRAKIAYQIEGERGANKCTKFPLYESELSAISGWDEIVEGAGSWGDKITVCRPGDPKNYDAILAEDVLRSGLVIMFNLQEVKVEDASYAHRRPTPKLLVDLDLSQTPYEHVRDWLHLLTAEDPWESSMDAPRTRSGQEYLDQVLAALPHSHRPEFIPVWRDAIAAVGQLDLPGVASPWRERPLGFRDADQAEAEKARYAWAPGVQEELRLLAPRPNTSYHEPTESRFLPPDAAQTAQIAAALSEVD